MKFTNASLVSEVIWNLRLGDLPRGTNRAWINRVANGEPPYTEQERQANNIEINVNFLDCCQLLADARRSYYNGFQSPGKFFTVTFDFGPPQARMKWGRVITSELQRLMKPNRLYAECLDSQFASTVCHGIGPAAWIDSDHWVPEEKGIEDVLIPSDTLRSLRNLDYFAVFYQYTPEQMYRLTHGPRRDPAWQMDMVEAALQWANSQTQSQLSYNDLFAPEKVEERFKQDLGFYGTDAVPTIDFWKFYYHEDKGGQSGWRMRAIIDTPGDWEVAGSRRSRKAPATSKTLPSKNLIGKDHSHYLYNPGDRVYATDIEQLIHFQFGDLSAVSPFKYHSIRGLGWLLYSVCQLQNRVMGKYYEAVIENMNQYFRGNEGDRTRVTKVDLVNYGFVPEGLQFVRPEERWQINERLSEAALDRLRNQMEYSAAQYRQGRDAGGTEKEKTATEVMAQVNSAMSMVGTMLTQAYRYQGYQYKEIARRFCKKDSRDPEVRTFRANVLRKGVPEKALDSSRWNIEAEKVMGGGNKTLQLAMAQSLLEMRPMLDPESQRIVDRIVIAVRTDNDELAQTLVPEIKTPSNSAHDAMASFASLMMGVTIPPQNGVNHVDAIESLLGGMAQVVKKIEASGGMATAEQISGLQNVAQHVTQHMQILAQNPAEKSRVRQYGKELGQLMNLVKAYAQRLQEQMQKQAQAQAQGNGGVPPEAQAKIAATQAQAQAKIQNTRESHGLKTAQRKIQFEQQMIQDKQKHRLEMAKEAQKMQLDLTGQALKTAADVRRGNMKSTNETD